LVPGGTFTISPPGPTSPSVLDVGVASDMQYVLLAVTATSAGDAG